MYLSHIKITIPKGSEHIARVFYVALLGLREVAKPASLRARGVCLDAGGLELHLSAGKERDGLGSHWHFGMGCGDVEGLKARLRAAGVPVEDGQLAPRESFIVYDPFGNRLEIHAPGAGHLKHEQQVNNQ